MGITALNRQAKPVPDGLVEAAARAAIDVAREASERPAPCADRAVHIVLVDEAHIIELNRAHLGRDEPTDVIAFPSGETDEDGDAVLGEAVVCVDVAERQSGAQGHSPHEELVEVVAHGVLHLLGYDDATADQRRQMELLQRQALARLRERGELIN